MPISKSIRDTWTPELAPTKPCRSKPQPGKRRTLRSSVIKEKRSSAYCEVEAGAAENVGEYRYCSRHRYLVAAFAYTRGLHLMKDFYICDCVRYENKIVTASFVVVSKQIKPKKSGEPYLALTLGDRSGHLEAKMWDNVEEGLDAFEQDDFLKIKGLVNKYKNRFQLTIHKLRKRGESEMELADSRPKTTKHLDRIARQM